MLKFCSKTAKSLHSAIKMLSTSIIVGKIIAPHGVRGDVRIVPLTDDPKRFYDLKEVMLDDGSVLVIESVKMHNQYVLLQFKGYHDRTAVEALRGQMLRISRDQAVPLGRDEYYTCDIIGLNVYLESGEYIGKIVNIIETGSNDVYVAQQGKERTLIPALKRVVKEINLEEQKMVVVKEEELEVR